MAESRSNLNPGLKTKWIEALRSGKYNKGRKYLYRESSNSYCCLGVLAEICGYDKDVLDNYMLLDSVDSGLATAIDPSDVRSNKTKLENMNDGLGGEKEHSFLEISNWIEANL